MKCKKPHKSCRCNVGNGGDFGGNRKTRTQERVCPVAANPDNSENNKEAGGGAQGTQGLSKNCTSRESVSLCRVWSEVFVICKGSNEVGSGIGVGGRNGDGNGVGGGNGDGDGEGTGAGNGVKANEGTQDGHGDESGDGAGTRTGTRTGTRVETTWMNTGWERGPERGRKREQ